MNPVVWVAGALGVVLGGAVAGEPPPAGAPDARGRGRVALADAGPHEGVFAALLREGGLAVVPAGTGGVAVRLEAGPPQVEEGPAPMADADLVVIFPRPPRQSWTRRDFDRLRKRKVLAMGESGAELLGVGGLLNGNPQGWHADVLPKVVGLPGFPEDSPFAGLLTSPLAVGGAADAGGGVRVSVHEGPGKLPAIGIYDGGEFPGEVAGLGREEGSDGHHWAIVKHGDFTLWGIDPDPATMTAAGKRLFVNLCDALVRAPAEEVRFPVKVFATKGTREGVLKAGHRNSYHYAAAGAERLRIRLAWKGDVPMMLRADPPWVRRDGASPLEIDLDAAKGEIMIVVGSFELPQGREQDYTLTLETR